MSNHDDDTRRVGVDFTSALNMSDMAYEDRVELCVQLGLVETVTHGDHIYARMTTKGRDAFSAMLRLMVDATMYGDEDRLQVS